MELSQGHDPVLLGHNDYQRIIQMAKLSSPELASKLDKNHLVERSVEVQKQALISSLVLKTQSSTPFQTALSVMKRYQPPGGPSVFSHAAASLKTLLGNLISYSIEKGVLEALWRDSYRVSLEPRNDAAPVMTNIYPDFTVGSTRRKLLETNLHVLQYRTIGIIRLVIQMGLKQQTPIPFVASLVEELLCYLEFRKNELQKLMHCEEQATVKPGGDFDLSIPKDLRISSETVEYFTTRKFCFEEAYFDSPLIKIPGTLWTKWFCDLDQDFFRTKEAQVVSLTLPESGYFLASPGMYISRRNGLRARGLNIPYEDHQAQYRRLSQASGEQFPPVTRTERIVVMTNVQDTIGDPFRNRPTQGRYKLSYWNEVCCAVENEPRQNLAQSQESTVSRFRTYGW
ncbi:uncharacterized protein E0L32_004977 [Thyridium curvatum]|uniref:Uncharacterized protein n=1 Tax=Thyridium curvatum TaxID=1093900 RepID=A0A507BDM3_9PEZI|nr:uncharacterized protein E0L32_004977 [Thyridium curvatum]TPX14868.1 hypothetical protein E0L32_004977 [Thyridium curvatum]